MNHRFCPRKPILTGVLCSLIFLVAASGRAGAQVRTSYSDGFLSVQATNVRLESVLRSVSDATGLEILVSEELSGKRVTARIESLPLELALKRLLSSFSHTVIYESRGEAIVPTSVKVYPQGSSSGPVIAVNPEQPVQSAALPQKGPETPRPRTGPAKGVETTGALLPNPYTHQYGRDAGSDSLSGMGMRLELQERKAFQEIEALERRIAQSRNPDEEEALRMVLQDKVAAFRMLQQKNRSKMESLRRIERFHEQEGALRGD